MFKKILLVAAALAVARAQFPNLGWCPNYAPMSAFNMTKFLGSWYEHARYFQLLEMGSRCVMSNYTVDAEGKVVVINEQTNRFTGIKTVFKGVIIPSETKGEEGKVQIKYAIPIFPDTRFTILDTDYTNFAVLWSCGGLGPVNGLNAWLMTRERKPSEKVLQMAYGVLDKYRLSKSLLFKSNQEDCASDDPTVTLVNASGSSGTASNEDAAAVVPDTQGRQNGRWGNVQQAENDEQEPTSVKDIKRPVPVGQMIMKTGDIAEETVGQSTQQIHQLPPVEIIPRYNPAVQICEGAVTQVVVDEADIPKETIKQSTHYVQHFQTQANPTGQIPNAPAISVDVKKADIVKDTVQQSTSNVKQFQPFVFLQETFAKPVAQIQEALSGPVSQVQGVFSKPFAQIQQTFSGSLHNIQQAFNRPVEKVPEATAKPTVKPAEPVGEPTKVKTIEKLPTRVLVKIADQEAIPEEYENVQQENDSQVEQDIYRLHAQDQKPVNGVNKPAEPIVKLTQVTTVQKVPAQVLVQMTDEQAIPEEYQNVQQQDTSRPPSTIREVLYRPNGQIRKPVGGANKPIVKPVKPIVELTQIRQTVEQVPAQVPVQIMQEGTITEDDENVQQAVFSGSVSQTQEGSYEHYGQTQEGSYEHYGQIQEGSYRPNGQIQEGSYRPNGQIQQDIYRLHAQVGNPTQVTTVDEVPAQVPVQIIEQEIIPEDNENVQQVVFTRPVSQVQDGSYKPHGQIQGGFYRPHGQIQNTVNSVKKPIVKPTIEPTKATTQRIVASQVPVKIMETEPVPEDDDNVQLGVFSKPVSQIRDVLSGPFSSIRKTFSSLNIRRAFNKPDQVVHENTSESVDDVKPNPAVETMENQSSSSTSSENENVQNYQMKG